MSKDAKKRNIISISTSTTTSSKLPEKENDEPNILSDARFRTGRSLVKSGKDGAISIFATLVEESIHKYGSESVETAACYYEYGNAIFRELSRKESSKESNTTDTKPSSKEEKVEIQKNVENFDKKLNNEKEEKNDVELSLELMENSWAILDKYISSCDDTNKEYMHWSSKELPRILIGIGDVLSFLERHADAADAYTRALPYRESIIKQYNKNNMTLDFLKQRRLYCEVNVLIAEELLRCPKNKDVVTKETCAILVKASEKIDFIKGYYDKARDELQETVYLMGRIAASGQQTQDVFVAEKENICFLSTMLMYLGNSLLDMEEENKK